MMTLQSGSYLLLRRGGDLIDFWLWSPGGVGQDWLKVATWRRRHQTFLGGAKSVDLEPFLPIWSE